MTNREIASILFNICALLKAQHGNPYRMRAYRRAARNLLRARHPVAERARAGEPLGIPQLGPRLTKTITRLALDGRADVYDELVGELPTAQQTLLQVPGIGPTLAQRITRDLGTEESDELIRRAAAVGLQRVWGIGPVRAGALVAALAEHAGEQAGEDIVARQVFRDGNLLYVQESFWNGERDIQPPAERAA